MQPNSARRGEELNTAELNTFFWCAACLCVAVCTYLVVLNTFAGSISSILIRQALAKVEPVFCVPFTLISLDGWPRLAVAQALLYTIGTTNKGLSICCHQAGPCHMPVPGERASRREADTELSGMHVGAGCLPGYFSQ